MGMSGVQMFGCSGEQRLSDMMPSLVPVPERAP